MDRRKPVTGSPSERQGDYFSCDEFATCYKREHPEATIVYGRVDGDPHAWIYDPTLGASGATLDPTLGQFFGYEPNWWPGDDHPHANRVGTADTVRELNRAMSELDPVRESSGPNGRRLRPLDEANVPGGTWAARFINREDAPNGLPRSWTHPQIPGERRSGAQTLRVPRALEIAAEGEDPRDDWFRGGRGYSHLALLKVSDFSGDKRPLTYRAVEPGDIEAMWVVDLDRFDSLMLEVAEALEDQGVLDPDEAWNDYGFLEPMWWDGHLDEVLKEMVDRMRRVEPRWIGEAPER